jgi:type I restriction enzyme S subunit
MSVQVPLFDKRDLKASKPVARVEGAVGGTFDVKKFVENFDALAQASGGVEHLRGLIIDLAIRGKLGTQSPKDGTAKVLLERAASERGNSGRRRVFQGKPQPSYALPPGWAWCEPQDLGEVSPRNEVDDGSIVGFVPMAKVPTDYRQAVTFEARRWKEIKKGYTHVQDGDIAVAKITPCFQNGKSCVVVGLPNGVGAGTTELLVLRPVRGVVEPNYLLLFFKSPDFISAGIGLMTGTAGQQRVPVEYFSAVSVPLPPLAEQKRIVAKVDQLMTLCDELEARQTKKREVGTRLTKSALEALTTAEGPEEFDAAWATVVENFDIVVGQASTVGPLRAAILRLGCTGKLVKRVPFEGDASGILASLQKMSPHTVRRGVPDRVDVSPLVAAWRLPAHWVAVSIAELLRVGELVDVKDGNHGANHPLAAEYVADGVPFIMASNVRDCVDYEGAKKLPPEVIARLRVGFAKPGDVIYTHKGSVGRVALNTRACILTPQTTYYRIRRPHRAIVPEYLRFVLMSSMHQEQVAGVQEQTTRDFVPVSRQYAVFLPLPPVEEQRRIIAKVEPLMKLCDALEANLRRLEDRATKLVESAVQEMVA